MKYKDIEFNSKGDLSRKLNRCNSYVSGLTGKGYTCEEIIDMVLEKEKKVKTYRGITWRSETELSSKLGKHHSYVNYNHHKGKTYEQIIDEYLDSKNKSA